MDMNYGCDVSNRYTGYLDSSDHGNAMNNAAGKNKRKTKKRRKSKNSTQKAISVVDKCINTSQTHIECNGNEDEDGGLTLQQQQQQQQQEQHQQQFFDGKSDGHENDVDHHENDAQYTDGPTSLISCDSTVQSDTSKEVTASDEQSNNTTDDQPTTTENDNENETKWSVICCEEEKAAAAAAAAEEQKVRDEPELKFEDQRIYPTVYFYNSNFGRHRRVVYDFHDGGFGRGGAGGRRHSNHSYHDASRTRQQMVKTQSNHYGNTESNEQMQNNTEKKRRNRNRRHRKNYSTRSDTTDYNNLSDTNGMHFGDDAEKYSNTSYNDSNDRTSYGPSTPTPPDPLPTAQKYNNSNNNNSHEYPKNHYNRFKNGMPERTFTRRRTDLVRNV